VPIPPPRLISRIEMLDFPHELLMVAEKDRGRTMRS